MNPPGLPPALAPHRQSQVGREPPLELVADIIQPLLDVKGCARLLGVSPDMVERLRFKAGLPAINLGFQRSGRRPKGKWRFDPVQVREWWRRRTQIESDRQEGGCK